MSGANVLQWLESEGLAVTHIALSILPFAAGIFLGVQAAKRWNRYLAWTAGIVGFFIVGFMFYPVIELIEKRGCELNPDYENCYQ